MGLFFVFTPREIMAVGKNKGLAKTGKKGVKKKVVDPFTRKDWYDIKAPSVFKVRDVGKTLVNRTQGTKLASDKLRSMVKKWQTLIEAHIDVKTTDGYLLRVFCIGFTQKQQHSTKKHCYAQSQQIRQIRKKMVDIIAREVSTVDLKEVVNKLIPDSMSMDIQKACQGIYPLHDVHIRKVKVMRRPRFDLAKLMELHGEGGKATTTTTDPN